jgi:hypothetical protein
VLGTFSGTDVPPPLVSTGPDMFVRFQTDMGNYGFQTEGIDDDPGFYVDWHFVDAVNLIAPSYPGAAPGTGICPAASVLTEQHGVIHDDDVGNVDCSQPGANCGGQANQGYADNLNCYTTIHAPTGDQVRFTFTQMNLEGPGTQPGCQPCSDPRGCDWVAIHDGPDESSPLIGTYSGHHLGWQAGEDYLPTIVSSGQDLHIRFKTDTHNCGIDSSEDPGWLASWDFIDNGQDICHPDTAVLRDPHGTLHDDDPAGNVQCTNPNDCGGVGGDNGYSDNLDCGVRIRAPKDSTVNIHFTQMNIEGGNTGLCATGQIDCSTGGDYVEIYDGRNAHAPLLGHITGDVTDDRIQADTFTSTGRDMFVRFVTDEGNYGLTGTTDDPGFWAEWQFIDDGADCMEYNAIPATGIVGHNNENIQGTVEQCQEACCARDWCHSFDFIGDTTPGSTTPGTCALADVDISNDRATNTAWASTVYERTALATIAGPGSAASCAAELAQKSAQINDECCPAGGCDRGAPDHCSVECDTVWTPFSKRCSIWLEQNPTVGSTLSQVTTLCENEEYGVYRHNNFGGANNNHGRCGDGDWRQYLDELGPACCGDGGDPGTPQSPHCKGAADQYGIIIPTETGQVGGSPVCSPECADLFEDMYAECHPRFEELGIGDQMKGILGTCQGTPYTGAAGGGHRRAQLDEEAAEAEAAEAPGFA